MAKPTILDAIRASINSEPLGEGNSSSVFPLREELHDLVLRGNTNQIRSLREHLNSTTSLSSPSFLRSIRGGVRYYPDTLGVNVGQRLFEGALYWKTDGEEDGTIIALHRLVEGKSYDAIFREYWEAKRKEYSQESENATAVRAHKARVHMLAHEIPQEGYDTLLQTIGEAIKKGAKLDFDGDNIIIDKDKKTIGIVDADVPTVNEHSSAHSLRPLLEHFLAGSVFISFIVGEGKGYLSRPAVAHGLLIRAHDSDIDEEFQKDCRIIVEKFICAIEKNNLPIVTTPNASMLKKYCGYEGNLSEEASELGQLYDRMNATNKFLSQSTHMPLKKLLFQPDASTQAIKRFSLSAAPSDLRKLLEEEQGKNL